jgi:anionic cell wall polymer biosynthesis LytR-Cps2A-Psr (LCP) family protein
MLHPANMGRYADERAPTIRASSQRIPHEPRVAACGLIATAAAVVLVALGVSGLVLERQRAYDRNIQRMPGVFPAESDRPARVPGRAENWLLVGSDRRADQATTGRDATQPLWRYGAQRADTIMLVHLPADRDRIYLVSFPRDAWVPIQGHGDAKRKVVWPAGTHHLDGARALDFVRQRHNLPGGDLGRIKRQQAFLKALARQAVDRGTLTNPLRLNAFLDATTKSVSADQSLTIPRLRSLAPQFRSVRAGGIVFVTAPVAGMGAEGRQSVVYLDRTKGQPLYQALRTDAVAGYLTGAGGSVNQVDEVR